MDTAGDAILAADNPRGWDCLCNKVARDARLRAPVRSRDPIPFEDNIFGREEDTLGVKDFMETCEEVEAFSGLRGLRDTIRASHIHLHENTKSAEDILSHVNKEHRAHCNEEHRAQYAHFYGIAKFIGCF